MDLIALREQIDEVDRQIVALYERRMDIAVQVAEYKLSTGREVFDRKREEDKLNAVMAMTRSEFNRRGIALLYEQIMAASRARQHQLMAGRNTEGENTDSQPADRKSSNRPANGEPTNSQPADCDKRRTQELIIYRGTDEDRKLLGEMVWLMEHYREAARRAEAAALLGGCLNRLFLLAEETGFSGNLWHCYLTDLLVNHENSFSRACEINGAAGEALGAAVLHDLTIFRAWFGFELADIGRELASDIVPPVLDYQPAGTGGRRVYSQAVGERIGRLAGELAGALSAVEMRELLVGFYREYGVGKLGLHQAFRVEAGARIVPIVNLTAVSLQDLVGYELPKRKLLDNTEAFLQGKAANNCLLYGDAGTGKSSSIKGLVNEYYGQGLRIIEIYKHQCGCLNEVMAQIKNRNYKFILYMDDLSFEDFEVEYKYLKAVIEGGLEQKPDNVLIYATSNRRHLIREKFSDKEDRQDDLHKSDTVSEKLSLAARFGVTIYFGAPGRKEFHQIVMTLAKRRQIMMPADILKAEADRWEMAHGGLSGRSARQFIDYLAGREQ